MALSNVATFVKTPTNGVVQILPADTTSQKTVYTAGANGSKITGLNAASTDTAAHDVQVSVTRSGVSYPIGTINVPAGAGNSSGVTSVNMLNFTFITGLAIDSDGNPFLLLSSGDTLTLSSLVTVTAGKTLTFVVTSAGDF